MVCLSVVMRILLLGDVVFGILSGFYEQYALFFLSIAILYVLLTISPVSRHHGVMALFVYSFLICIPINLRMSVHYSEFMSYASTPTSLTVALGVIAYIILSSIEEIVLCLVGRILWGEQSVMLES